MVPREEVLRIAHTLRTCCDFGLSALRETGDSRERSVGELSSGVESLCPATGLPSSEPCPPGLATSSGRVGLEQRDVADPVLLPTATEEEAQEEEEEEEERVGLC